MSKLTIRSTDKGPLPFAPATGKSIEIADTSIFRIEGGKIAEQWAVTDQLSLLVQLGQVEAPA